MRRPDVDSSTQDTIIASKENIDDPFASFDLGGTNPPKADRVMKSWPQKTRSGTQKLKASVRETGPVFEEFVYKRKHDDGNWFGIITSTANAIDIELIARRLPDSSFSPRG